ncbi:unnamed protein product [Orchesella dallaii]|uniref:Uncharacterized protein n=1 Tax=Orchesella dallaii TaxID=48710 RepID=A0ABP1PP41_9HEXA
MCDGKHSSRRDVVILSIKPKRPEYPINQKVVPVSELLQEWDKLDAYYRGQLLKLTKSLNKSNKHKQSRHSNTPKVSNNHNNKHNKSSPVNKKHSSSLSSDQFTELFGDENLFSPTADTNNNSRHNKNKLLHTRSLNSLFDEDSDNFSPPPPPSRIGKNSLSNVQTNNLVVSIPVLTHPGDHCNKHHRRKYASDDDDDDDSGSGEEEDDEDEEEDNFLSVPRENYQVQYGTKQKTRVTLIETGNVSPRWIVPIRVAPYKPPTAQGLNGVQIQKILYHKNDSSNFASPTTTTARTPDKPPDNPTTASAPTVKSIKVTESPVSTVSPQSTSASTTMATPSGDNNNNATPKQPLSASQTPELSSPPSDQGGSKKIVSTTAPTTTMANKLSSPPVNSTTGQKLKRPNMETSPASGYTASKVNNGHLNGIKRPKTEDNHAVSGYNSSVNNFTPVTSTSSTYPGGSGGVDDPAENDRKGSRATGIKGEETTSPTKFNKNFSFVKPSSQSTTFSSSSSASSGDSPGAVFIPPAAVSITDRIIKKASRPQPELIERQRRRRQESNQRKSYAMQKGDEHEERESIDLSMKSFEMIWNVPLLSPLRSP